MLVLLLIPILFLRAKVWSAHAAYAHTEHLIAVREDERYRRYREMSDNSSVRNVMHALSK